MSEKLRNGNARSDHFKVLLCAYCKAKSANSRKLYSAVADFPADQW